MITKKEKLNGIREGGMRSKGRKERLRHIDTSEENGKTEAYTVRNGREVDESGR